MPLPGETALIAAAVVCAHGPLNLVLVILVATVAAIVGDSIGYLIGRKGGRRLLERRGPLQAYRMQLLERGEPFFERHGPKAVFLGRWFTVLRITAAWLAGINRMRWPTFVMWNALGAVLWATTVGLLAYWIGPHAERLLRVVGVGGAAAVVGLLILLGVWRWRRGQARTRAARSPRAHD